MTNRCTTAQSTEVVRRWAPPAIVTLAATAVVTALTAAPPAGAAAPPPRRGAPPPGPPGASHRGGGPARRGRADHGDRIDQEPEGDHLRRRRLGPSRAGVDRNCGTRDASRRLQRRGEGQGPSLEPL